jgi:transposase InsO family protein
MSKVLQGLLGVCCLLYIDDIVVYGTDDSFEENLREVLQRLADFDVVLKGSKCRFGVRQITYLGHTLDGEKLFVHESKAEIFKLLREPTNLTALRSFVGLMNYYKDHMGPLYSQTMAPLYTKIAAYGKKTKVALTLSEIEREAFVKIKNLAIDSNTLYFIKSEGDLFLKTDASQLAFGGTLTQLQKNEEGVMVERDISFFSKTFSETQRRWSTSDQEMYAIYYGVRQLHQFLSGRKFVIFSDHEALRHDDKPSHSAKINRWKMHLSEYDFTIKHISGTSNIVADALSRCMVSDTNQDNDIDSSEIIVSLASMQANNNKYDLENSQDRLRLLQLYHGEESGHYDFKSTAARMQANGHVWPGGSHDLKQFILHCSCQKYIPRPQAFHEAAKSLSTAAPNTRWDIDLIVLEEDVNRHNCALLIIDSCDRFIMDIHPLSSFSFSELEPVLVNTFCRMGKPLAIMADGAGNFGSKGYEDLMKFLNIQRIPTIPRNSQDNAIVERTIRTVKTQSAAIREERFLVNRSNSWKEILPLVMRNHNARVHSSTGFAPAAVRFGIADSLSDKSDNTYTQYHMLQRMQININNNKAKSLRGTGPGITDSLQIGKRYWFYNPDRKKSALEPIFLGPFTLTNQENGKAVIEDVRGISRVCHISELRPFRGDD